MSPSGSHLVDACWTVTQGMNNYRTGIAEELIRGEADVRASLFGRIVWRNWAMDKYKTRRGDWFRLGKGDEDAVSEHQGSAGTAGAANSSGGGGSPKSAIQVRIRLCLCLQLAITAQLPFFFSPLKYPPPQSTYAQIRRCTPSFCLFLGFQNPDLIPIYRSRSRSPHTTLRSQAICVYVPTCSC